MDVRYVGYNIRNLAASFAASASAAAMYAATYFDSSLGLKSARDCLGLTFCGAPLSINLWRCFNSWVKFF